MMFQHSSLIFCIASIVVYCWLNYSNGFIHQSV